MVRRAILQLVRVANATTPVGDRDYVTAIINATVIAGLSFFGALVAIGVTSEALSDIRLCIYRAFITAGVTFFSSLAVSLGLRNS